MRNSAEYDQIDCNKNHLKNLVVTDDEKQLFVALYANVQTNLPMTSRWVPWKSVVDGLLAVRMCTPEKKSVLAICFAKCNGPRRLANAEAVTALVLDCDSGMPLETIWPKIERYEFLVYSTYSHTLDKPKYRIIFPLARLVSAKEYSVIWEALNTQIGGIADTQASDAVRLNFAPSCPEENIEIAFGAHNVGQWLDPDELIATAQKKTSVFNSRPTVNSFTGPSTKANTRLKFGDLPTPEAVLKQLNIAIPSRINGSGYWQLTCPFHKDGKEQEPSLSLHNIDGYYRCFACGAKGGSIVAFFMAVTGKSFKQAKYILRARK